MPCSCGNRADVQIPNGPALCMRCYTAYQNTVQENQRLNFAFLNYLQDEMAFAAGLPRIGPRVRVPGPITMNTTNNIRVEAGSQVGQINAGALLFLNRAVTAFND